jgi:hypothetical protein
MARRMTSDERIYFPWEARSGFRRFFAAGRVRPVLVIFAIVGFVVLVAMRERQRAGVRQTRATLVDLRRAVDGYLAEHSGSCPPGLEAVLDYSNFKELPRDAWGNPFRLVCPGHFDGAPYELTSDGPDEKPGGLDRIQ